ncbi:hypothetical protein [Aequorivita echinoideorum]|uniref:Uncharacterized protein n=1 Tax=Aequorivita echinoideorum TaxID=1549647 RepID=A0ABS5S3W8_9FLAO|nr:hypothetical protein [Aequorivita echinoideorum]MBT0607888.1 hypothetical protein [Aequorivita echinoideorum]
MENLWKIFSTSFPRSFHPFQTILPSFASVLQCRLWCKKVYKAFNTTTGEQGMARAIFEK